MKYGIITHYDVHNHGALLQLNALKQVLSGMGISACALQFDKNYDFIDRELRAKYKISLKSINVYLKFLAERGLRCTFFNLRKKRVLNQYRREQNLLGPFYTESGELDGVVIGSDEVFALHTGPTPALFGYSLPANKVFAYGGCFGPTTLVDIDRLHCRSFVKGGLESMVGISMRDQNSIEIATELIGSKPDLVCDPVILYGYKDELSRCHQRPIKEPYLVVYSYDNRFEGSADTIIEYARGKKLRIVSPGFFQKWADINANVNPEDLLCWFKYADCVITNTFHGCVLSLISGVDMAVKIRDNANKLLFLLQEYSLTERIFGDSRSLEEVFSVAVNWDVVNAQINSRRESSLSYLKRMVDL